MYNKTMKKKNTTHKGIENKPYIEAMRELRRSNAATTHDNRPNRLRTRKAIKAQAIRENEQFDVGGLGYNSNTNKEKDKNMNGSLPENPATQEQYDRLRDVIRERVGDEPLLTYYAILAGNLSLGVSADAMERLIFLNELNLKQEQENN